MAIKKHEMKCGKCHKKMTVTQDVAMKYHGLEFTIRKYAGTCYQCFKKNIVAGLQNMERDGFFKVADGKVIVDWNKCIQARQYRDDFDTIWYCIRTWLINFGVLSYNIAGNYMVMQDGSQYALHNCGSSLYFADQADAEGFVEANLKKHRGTLDNFSIVKVSHIVRRSRGKY